jgi:hypothetical protein
MIKKIFFAGLSFLGWILSPFTWWNDAFVNLPLSYLAASFINRSSAYSFLYAFLISYWLTNVLGIVLMYVGASGISLGFAERRAAKGLIKNKIWVLVTTITIYSIIAAFIIRLGIVRPFNI